MGIKADYAISASVATVTVLAFLAIRFPVPGSLAFAFLVLFVSFRFAQRRREISEKAKNRTLRRTVNEATILINSGKNQARALLARATAYLKLGDYEKCLDDLDSVTECTEPSEADSISANQIRVVLYQMRDGGLYEEEIKEIQDL